MPRAGAAVKYGVPSPSWYDFNYKFIRMRRNSAPPHWREGEGREIQFLFGSEQGEEGGNDGGCWGGNGDNATLPGHVPGRIHVPGKSTARWSVEYD